MSDWVGVQYSAMEHLLLETGVGVGAQRLGGDFSGLAKSFHLEGGSKG